MAFLLRVLCLFSEVKGVVLQHGKPVANAEVGRIHEWKKAVSQIVNTDEQGRFSFPVAAGHSLLAPLLPFENVISQMIMIRYNSVEYEAWMFSKRDFGVNEELGANQSTWSVISNLILSTIEKNIMESAL